jgi:hypothetical protein
MIPNASLTPMARSNGRGMYNYEIREYASAEYKGRTPEHTASMLKDTLPLTESAIKMRRDFALIGERCQARGSYANGCLFSFAIFGGAVFLFKLATLVL